MKRVLKKSIMFVLALVFVLTVGLFVPQNIVEAEAATKYEFLSDAKNKTVYYAPDDNTIRYIDLDISGYPKSSQIKNLKSSKPSAVRVQARSGCVRAYIRGTGTATISCKIGGQTISTKLTVKKWSNPFNSFKLDKTEFKTKFNKATGFEWFHTNKISSKKLTLKVKNGWKITSVYSYNGGSSKSKYGINKNSYTMSGVSMKSIYDDVKVTLLDVKNQISYTIDLEGYLED